MTEAVGGLEKGQLLLDAARFLAETLEPRRVYERFHDILTEAIPHDGLVVSSYERADGLIRCEYAWVDGAQLDPSIFPPVHFVLEDGGLQSEVIRTGVPLLTNELDERVRDGGTYYDVDGEGTLRKVPDEGAPKAQAAMMLPLTLEGRVFGVVQLMSDYVRYDAEQLELAEAMVAQLAAASRIARLHRERIRLESAEEAARAIAATRETAERVLETVGDGIAALDPEGTVAFWNAAAARITGSAREEVLGRPATEVFPGWDRVASKIAIGAGGEQARPVTVPVELEGRERWLSVSAVSGAIGTVYTFRDITSEQRLDERTSDFITTVSHELRTPMTAVLGAAKTLLREDIVLDENARRQLLEMIASQAVRLGHVTDEVLLASSLERDDVELRPAPVEVSALVRAITASLEPALPAGVRLELATEVGCKALCDRGRLEQIVANLLDNAAKYSPAGGTVRVTVARLGADVEIGVADEGIGIPSAEQERIFEKFYRVDPNMTTTGTSGTGLGLYISRELVRRMGGRVSVCSTPGAGSTFTVVLPAA